MFYIVREFLEQFDLEFTISVFEPESYMNSNYEYIGREQLIQDLDIPGLNQESSDPVLLQLIQLCRINNTSKSTSTRSTNKSVSNLNNKNDLISQSNCNETGIVNAANESDISSKSVYNLAPHLLNETFEVAKKKDETSFLGSKYEEHDSQHTESSMGDSLKEKLLIDFDKSLTLENLTSKSELEKSQSLLEQSLVEDFSPPIVKDIKHSKLDTSFDKLKLPCSKTDKIKAKNNFSSLSDLPPLQMSKSRTNDMLLPSLYTKEFKDKGSAKDVDKLFELEPMDNYEEDFISESEMDLTLNKPGDVTKTDLLRGQSERDLIKCENTEKSSSNICFKSTDLVDKEKLIIDSHSTASSVTSEDFEMSSNVDDILNSC